jgi:hypothetical protein
MIPCGRGVGVETRRGGGGAGEQGASMAQGGLGLSKDRLGIVDLTARWRCSKVLMSCFLWVESLQDLVLAAAPPLP